MGNAVPAYATELAAKLGPLLGATGAESAAPRPWEGLQGAAHRWLRRGFSERPPATEWV